jgi:hypothetical protein
MKTLNEIFQAGRQALFERLGPTDALRYLNQYRCGQGDYTKDRGQWLTEQSVDEIAASIAKAKERAG